MTNEITTTDNGEQMAQLMRVAVEQGEAGVAALERLVAMRERERDDARQMAFNSSMRAAQQDMGRISADAHNNQTRSNYATYGKLDKALRPIYTAHGFAVSFDSGEISDDTMPVYAYVSHEMGHTRKYTAYMDCSGKGAKGGDVMTKTHARGSSMSYGMRYLLKMIFNVAIGEEDDDGRGAGSPDEPAVTAEQAANIAALAEEVGADVARFCKFMGVESIADIRASRYDKAITALEAKR